MAKRCRLLADERSRRALTKFVEGIEARAAVRTKEQKESIHGQSTHPKQEQVLFTSTWVTAAGTDATGLAIVMTLRHMAGHPECFCSARSKQKSMKPLKVGA